MEILQGDEEAKDTEDSSAEEALELAAGVAGSSVL